MAFKRRRAALVSKVQQAFIVGIILSVWSNLCIAAELPQKVHIAVASNFVFTLQQLTREFEKQTGIDTIISAGSSGKLYAQIIHGAPYDVFMSADVLRAEKLEQQNIALSGSRFTYATGKLVVWHPQIEKFSLLELANNDLHRIAIANPKLAPYGLAAEQAMQNLGIWVRLQTKLIRGVNVSQVLQFAQSGNVDVAFVSHAAMIALHQVRYLSVPQNLYDPIDQQAVQLQDSHSVRAFLTFLQGSLAKVIIQKHGYSTH